MSSYWTIQNLICLINNYLIMNVIKQSGGVRNFCKRVKYAFIYKVGLRFPYSKIRLKAFRAMGWEAGENVYFPADIIIPVSFVGSHGRLDLGDRVSIGPRVTLVVSSHANASRVRKVMPNKERRITIGNDVWLGAGVIVLPGITIGECSVIGAGAVVTKDIPPYSIAVGNPARVIKTINKSQL